jgi:hypothetical protein
MKPFRARICVVGLLTSPPAITEFATPTANSGPRNIAAGSDGALWLTENGGTKSRVVLGHERIVVGAFGSLQRVFGGEAERGCPACHIGVRGEFLKRGQNQGSVGA